MNIAPDFLVYNASAFWEDLTLPQEDKSALLRVIGGFIRDVKTKQAYTS
jgi:hypothetical protein